MALLRWNRCSHDTFSWKLPSLDSPSQTRSHHLPVDNVDSSFSKFLFIVTSHFTSYMSIFWQRSLRSQGPEDMLLPLQAPALLPEEDLRLCICRILWNACVRKGEHSVQALGGNSPLQTRIKGKMFQSAHHVLCWAIWQYWSQYRNIVVERVLVIFFL